MTTIGIEWADTFPHMPHMKTETKKVKGPRLVIADYIVIKQGTS